MLPVTSAGAARIRQTAAAESYHTERSCDRLRLLAGPNYMSLHPVLVLENSTTRRSDSRVQNSARSAGVFGLMCTRNSLETRARPLAAGHRRVEFARVMLWSATDAVREAGDPLRRSCLASLERLAGWQEN